MELLSAWVPDDETHARDYVWRGRRSVHVWRSRRLLVHPGRMVLQLIARAALMLLLAAAATDLAACGRAGSSAKVPKEAIEKAASTKIPDAGDAGDDSAE